MFVTCRPHGAKPQVKGASGPAGQPNPMVGRPHFESVQAETWRLRSHVGSQEYPMPESRWTIHHLQTISIKSVEAPLFLYIRILMAEFTDTTLFLEFSTCKGSGLVIEAQVKPCRESRLESSLCSSSVSSFGDQ
jgi:hypothetical protein